MTRNTRTSDLVAPNFNLSTLNNSLFDYQWHFGAPDQYGVVNPWSVPLVDVWQEYTGAGVVVGIIDEGFDTGHVDLAGRFDLDLSYDPRDGAGSRDINPDDAGDLHGTWVSGVIGAGQSGDTGLVGGAPESTMAGFYIRFGGDGSTLGEIADLLARQASVDVSNSSWGLVTPFGDNFRASWFDGVESAFETALTEGRGGLGTVFVFSAGNDRQYVEGDASLDGDNTNYHSFSNQRGTITVAASDKQGHVASFSTPGASILVAAPGTSIATTHADTTQPNAPSADYVYVSGTSFAAPIVSSVVALMLEANPDLGYRDVQAILAASAKGIDLDGGSWERNGATTWNGGGYHVSHDFGFGLVDAVAAVRLAETWTPDGDRASEDMLTVPVDVGAAAIPDLGDLTLTATVGAEAAGAFTIEWVEVDLITDHDFVGDLVVHLISPDGTDSVLVDRPGDGTLAQSGLNFTFSTNHHWGEAPAGTWSLVVEDQGTGGTGSVQAWALHFYGTTTGDDGLYVFTDEFADYGASAPPLADDGGTDTLNVAALSDAVTVDLRDGRSSTLAGQSLALAAGTVIENVVGTHGDDRVIGNGADNGFEGGRGRDVLYGFGGDDHIAGGPGDDRISGGGGADAMEGGEGADRFYGGAGNDSATGGAGRDIIYGDEDDDTLFGDGELDRLYGGDGNDMLDGGDDVDHLYGETGDDLIVGGLGDDLIYGGDGADRLEGGEGRDRLYGEAGGDVFVYEVGGGIDRIFDFSAAEGDTIEFAGFDFADGETILDFVRVRDDGIVIDLGDGDRLLVQGEIAADLGLVSDVTDLLGVDDWLLLA
ncbi:S8 family serine peptidase [Zavarzinia compransoris]|uniref:S8 family serine peptidase n=1 Tax=Zavarzinia marina TaxID=2911065 RepID=UPI001F1E4460|nr:S8 family serine peptidase [Zavarzinia marina]MCF4166622.1 S8 family serine peptidase [Zavarzinia marina]